jgi:hypothetical protein
MTHAWDWSTRREFWLLITPQIAAEWLQYRNTINRYIRDKVVDDYVRDFNAGHFMVTGETISFDWNGILINGQHRLTAIVESGKSIEILIVVGLDPAIRSVIDQHGKRNTVDAFTGVGPGFYLGENSSVGRNTAAGMWARIKIGMRGGKGHDTKSELLAFANQYPEGGLFALEVFGKHPPKRLVYVAPVLAAVARAYYHYRDTPNGLDRLTRFVDVLATGLQREPLDSSVIVLREWLSDKTGTRRPVRNSNAQPEVYGKTARVIRAYMSHELLTKIYQPSEDPFPLPGSVSKRAGRADRMALDVGLVGAGRPGARKLVV